MEPDQVSPAYPFQNFPSPWEEPKNLEAGKRYVQEKSNLDLWEFFPDQVWQKKQMVVMHPYGIVRICVLYDEVAKLVIHPLIGFPQVFVVHGIVWKVVEERPNRPVAKSVVVAVNLSLGKENRVTVVPAQLFSDLALLFRS